MLAPDDRNIALEINDADGEYDPWVMDVACGVMSRVTTAPDSERDPVWAQDSGSLAFIARSGQDWNLRRKGLRASDPEVVIASSPGDEDFPEYWLRDGRTLFVIRRNPEKNQQDSIWAVPVGGGIPTPVLFHRTRIISARHNSDAHGPARWQESHSATSRLRLRATARHPSLGVRLPILPLLTGNRAADR